MVKWIKIGKELVGTVIKKSRIEMCLLHIRNFIIHPIIKLSKPDPTSSLTPPALLMDTTKQVSFRQEYRKGPNIQKDVTPSPHSGVDKLWISLLGKM
jgi:hypothetical protein